MEAGLAAAGHDPSRPSYWVLEGLVGYLTRGAQEQLFKRLLALSAAGSWLLATAPPTPEYREDLAAKGFVLHHVTYETGADTLARVVAAGWGGGSGGNSSSGGNGSAKAAAGARLVSMHELCEKYRIQDLRILEFIVATSE